MNGVWMEKNLNTALNYFMECDDYFWIGRVYEAVNDTKTANGYFKRAKSAGYILSRESEDQVDYVSLLDCFGGMNLTAETDGKCDEMNVKDDSDNWNMGGVEDDFDDVHIE